MEEEPFTKALMRARESSSVEEAKEDIVVKVGSGKRKMLEIA
jgi:hypothetical protein